MKGNKGRSLSIFGIKSTTCLMANRSWNLAMTSTTFLLIYKFYNKTLKVINSTMAIDSISNWGLGLTTGSRSMSPQSQFMKWWAIRKSSSWINGSVFLLLMNYFQETDSRWNPSMKPIAKNNLIIYTLIIRRTNIIHACIQLTSNRTKKSNKVIIKVTFSLSWDQQSLIAIKISANLSLVLVSRLLNMSKCILTLFSHRI